MSSTRFPKWKSVLLKLVPALFKDCPERNHHWAWDRLCFCRRGEGTPGWHGGIYDMKRGHEYQPCQHCAEAALSDTGRKLEEFKNRTELAYQLFLMGKKMQDQAACDGLQSSAGKASAFRAAAHIIQDDLDKDRKFYYSQRLQEATESRLGEEGDNREEKSADHRFSGVALREVSRTSFRPEH